MAPEDSEEFLQVTLAHLDAVHALARRLVRNHADDLVQETWLKAYAAWPSGRPRDARAWLVTICLNTARSWYRRDQARPEVLASDAGVTAVSTADTEGEAVGHIRADAVHQALRTLPEPQRIAITLMDLSGFTATEVAVLIGAPRGTVLARVHRGRKALALALNDHAPQAAQPAESKQVRDEG